MILPYFNLHSHFSDTQNVTIFQADDEVEENQWHSIGIHPWSANEEIEEIKYLGRLSNQNCIAMGEIGLDKLKVPEMNVQIEIFQKQIEWSEKFELPVIIHCVKAWNELKVLKRNLKPSQPWIFHGFSKIGILDEILNEGFYVSFGMRILKDSKLLESATKVPNNKFFLETDDAKVDIHEIYGEFAKAKKIPLQTLKEIQFNNFKRVFKKWKNG